ncbi:MAG: DUF4168 domain-containing protein [Dichotomicrobium sp.]
MTFARLTLAALASAGLAFGAVMATPAAAQQTETQEQASFSDEKLRSFASAAVKLSQIRSEYQAQMGNAENDEERQALTQETNQQMAQAVEETEGISVEEYNEIASASRSNPEVAEKVETYMEEAAQ